MKENNTALEKTLREKNEFLQALFQVLNNVVSRLKSIHEQKCWIQPKYHVLQTA